MQQSARPTGLAGPPHQTHTHLGRAHTLAQASVHLSHSKSPGLPNDQSVNQSILVHSTALAQYLSLLSLLFSTSPTSSSHKPPLCSSQLPSQPATPSRHSESRGGSTGHTYHTLPHPSSYNSSPMWGPLEPPSTPKPWSLSCLRPAPPLRPSAALCQKEVLYTGTLK